MEKKHVASLPAKATPEFIKEYNKTNRKRLCYIVLHRLRNGNPNEYWLMFDDFERERYEEKLADFRPELEVVYYEHVTDMNFGWNEYREFEHFLVFELSPHHRKDDRYPEWWFIMEDASNPMHWIELYWEYKQKKEAAAWETFSDENKEREQLTLF
jgi:hypothetical protein